MGDHYDKRTINMLVLELNANIANHDTDRALDNSARLFGFMLGRIGAMQTQLDILCDSKNNALR
jgi:hypothetical protein